MESEHDKPENLDAPATAKHKVIVIATADVVADPAEISPRPIGPTSEFKDEAQELLPAAITCRPFMMKYSYDSHAEIRFDLGAHSCEGMRCCAAGGCSTLVCLTHGFGEGFEEPYNDDAAFPSPMCQQSGCDVVFCERHFGRMMTSCNGCANAARATMELEGSGLHPELAKSFFCPAHATVRCNLRYRFDFGLGDMLDEKEANRERNAVAKDRKEAEMGDSVLGSMGLSADCLFDEIARKKYKRETIDERRGIGHFSFKLCQNCFAEKRSHNCCFDLGDFHSLL